MSLLKKTHQDIFYSKFFFSLPVRLNFLVVVVFLMSLFTNYAKDLPLIWLHYSRLTATVSSSSHSLFHPSVPGTRRVQTSRSSIRLRSKHFPKLSHDTSILNKGVRYVTVSLVSKFVLF